MESIQLVRASTTILDQLSVFVNEITDNDFIRPISLLSGATIGQHLRHTLEFFICLEQGQLQRKINYDERQRDMLIETNRLLALRTIERIKDFILAQGNDEPLQLEVQYYEAEGSVVVETNFLRELIYNIEHAVHHMAIMKIGVLDVAPYVSLPVDFGVASSTLRHKAAGKIFLPQ